MARIVRLRPKASASPRPAPPGGAAIIFFPGVRYERLTENSTAKPSGHRRHKNRNIT